MADLQTAYRRLQGTQRGKVSVDELALWSQWTRLDARLGEIIVFWLSQEWKDILAVKLNKAIQKQPWPSVIGVLLEQCLEFCIPTDDKKLFTSWMKCVTCDLPNKHQGLYFIRTGQIHTTSITRQVLLSNYFFNKWGFLGKEIFVNKAKLGKKSYLAKAKRQLLLAQFVTNKQTITVNEYLSFLENLISRRTAELDLKNSKLLKSRGNTKGKSYWVKR